MRAYARNVVQNMKRMSFNMRGLDVTTRNAGGGFTTGVLGLKKSQAPSYKKFTCKHC